ncbi:PAS domain S-box protein [Rhodospirillum centenum]|nr:PAS domain S-box protein [Rhodospirillum centenum]
MPFRLALSGGLFAFGLAALALTGWSLGDTAPARLLGGPAMQPVAAVGIMAGAAALLLRLCRPRGARRAADLTAGLVVAVTAWTAAAYAFDLPLPLDHLFFADAVAMQTDTVVSGRMAPGTTLGLLPVALALLLAGRGRFQAWVPALATAGLLAPGLAMIRYLFGQDPLEGLGVVAGMAATTAVALLALGMGTLALLPERGWLGALTGDDAGARTARSLLPWAILAPLATTWVLSLGVRAGFYSNEFGLALIAFASIAVLSTAIFRHAGALSRTEARLRAERDRAGLYLHSAQVILLVLDRQGRIETINRAGRELLGHPPDADLAGRDWMALAVPPSHRAELRRLFEASIQSDIDLPERFENPVCRPDGSERLIAWRNTTLRDGAGRITGVISSGMDITERVATGTELAEREALLSAVLDALPVGVIIADAEGRIVRDNAANREIWGLPPETASWEGYADWVGWWPQTGERIKAHEWGMARALRTGETVRGELVECAQFGSGRRRFYLNNAAPVRNAAGQIVAGVVVEQDVTERMVADSVLRRVVEGAPFPVMVHAEDGTVVHVSQAWLSLTGYEPEEIGTLADWTRLAHGTEPPGPCAAFDALYDLDGPRDDGDQEVRTADGRHLLWSFRSAPVGVDARGRRLAVSMAADLTARREAEARLRLLMREVDHRAKNVLAVVQAVVRLTEAATPEEFAAAVEGRIGAMARAHSLLAVGGWSGVDLGRLVADELAAWEDGDRIAVTGTPVRLRAEAAQPVSLALHELATNAAKYGALSVPAGRLRLSWEERDGWLDLRWQERGGPAVQGPPTRRGFGTDLLDSTVAGQLGGRLDRFWDAEGLTCRIRLPADCWLSGASAGVDDARPGSPLTDPVPVPQGRAAILVVEDEPLTAMMIRRHLEGAGYTVIGPAARVPDALVLVGQRRIDAAVLDARLFGAFVTPVAAVLGAMGVPFLLCSGYASLAGLPTALRDVPLLPKPMEADALVRAVGGLLGRSS